MSHQLRNSYRQLESHSKLLEVKVRERTQALEQEMRDRLRSEATFQTLVSNVPGAVYRCHLDEHWTMKFLSRAIFDLCGYPAADFINNRVRSFADIVVFSEDIRLGEIVRKAIDQRQPYVIEYQILHADGSFRYVYDRGRGVFDEAGRLLYLDGVMLDSTPLKKAEAKVKISEQHYRSLFEDAPIALLEEDFSEVNRYLKELGVLTSSPKAEAGAETRYDDSAKSNIQDFEAYFDAHPQIVRECVARIRILDANQAALDLFEAKEKRDLLSVIEYQRDLDAIEGFKQEITALCEGRDDYESEIVRYTLTGKTRHLIFKEFVAPGHEQDWSSVLVSTLDISQRKRAEAQLQISEEKYRTLNESTQDAVMLLNRHYFIDCNPATLKMFGCEKKEDFCNKSPADFSPETQPDGRNSRRALRTTIATALRTGTCKFEWCHRRLDGTLFPAEVWLTAMELGGALKGDRVIQAVIRDITLRKRDEAEIIQARQKAEVANQAKSQFLANMSHELRSPLNAILGFSQVLSRSDILPADHQEDVKIINRSGEFLLSLINDILDMAKIESGHIAFTASDFNLHSLLDELHSLFKLRAKEKQLEIILRKSPTLPQNIHTDQSKLRQVLINLLGNAIKFTHTGSITIQAQLSPVSPSPIPPFTISPSPHPAVGHSQNSQNLCFSITDTGIGIDPADLDRLFQPFVQTHSGLVSQEGTGLGLAICRKFVQMMGGDISITSQLNQGTTVRFYIQATVTQPALTNRSVLNKKEQHVWSLAADQPRFKLLIVDDKAVNRQLLFKLLEPVGFELQAANNGQMAVEMARSWQPDLILMDLRMSVLDGIEAIREIRQLAADESSGVEHSQPKIIALSASSVQSEHTDAIAAGCDDFIRKPFKENALFGAIAQQLDTRYTYRESSKQTESPQQQNSSPDDSASSLLEQTFLKEVSDKEVSDKEVSDKAMFAEESQLKKQSGEQHISGLATLPEHILEALESAALRLQWDQLLTQIEAIRALDESLADRVNQAVENFRYGQVVESVRAVKTTEKDSDTYPVG